MKLLVSTALALGLLSSNAFAADLLLPQSAEVYVDDVAYDWSGFYAGGQLGYSFGTGVVDIPFYAQPAFDNDVDGWAAGLHAGANVQFDQFVLGAELSANWTNGSGRTPSGFAGEDHLIDQDWDASLVARAGFAADRVLVYALGGAAVTSLTTDYDPAAGESSDTVWGWTLGAGAEYAFTDTISGGLEYRYTDYAKADFFHTGASSVDFDTHTVKARLSFHF